MPAPIFEAAYQVRRAYWRVRKPETFGVKVAILDGEDNFLAIKNSYGNSKKWNLPGGGFKPSSETAEEAIRREVRQELGLHLGSLAMLPVEFSRVEGKRDTVYCFSSVLDTANQLKLNSEITVARWLPLDTPEPLHTIASRMINHINAQR